jgi:hypothetical protein
MEQVVQEKQDSLDKLEQLADLKQKGALTDEEFQMFKTDRLAQEIIKYDRCVNILYELVVIQSRLSAN